MWILDKAEFEHVLLFTIENVKMVFRQKKIIQCKGILYKRQNAIVKTGL